MSFLNTIVRYAADYRARRRRMSTYMEIASLPIEIQKDIGWAEEFDDEDVRARKTRRRG